MPVTVKSVEFKFDFNPDGETGYWYFEVDTEECGVGTFFEDDLKFVAYGEPYLVCPAWESKLDPITIPESSYHDELRDVAGGVFDVVLYAIARDFLMQIRVSDSDPKPMSVAAYHRIAEAFNEADSIEGVET
jgi:hypothetical protein